jgi:iron complex outermembrane receptor protein
MTLDQLLNVDVQRVTGASLFDQETLDAPTDVSVVTRDEIDTYGYRTLADVLRSVRGFYVSDDRNYSYIGINGFQRAGDYNTRVLVLIDGHRLNDNVYDDALLGTEFPLDIELIDRIEVVRGSTSSLYGSNALLAVVNIVTSQARTLGRASGSLDAGSLGTARMRLTGTLQGDGRREAVFSASGYRATGERNLFFPELQDLPGGGTARDMDHDRARNLFASASAGPWTAEAVWGDRTKGIPTGAYDTALYDPRSQTRDRRGYVDVQYAGAVHGTATNIRAAYDRYLYDGVYAAAQPDGSLDSNVFRDNSRGQWLTLSADASRRVHIAHMIKAGVEYRYDIQQDQGGAYDVDGVWLDQHASGQHWGAFVQDEFELSRRVLLNGGVRYDRYDDFGGTFNPRIALILKAQRRSSLKLLYGQSFRAPNAYERYYYGTTALRPEQTQSAAAVWEQHLAGRLRLSLSAFHYDIDDLISEVVADNVMGLAFVNAGSVAGSGVSAEVEASLRGAVRVLGSYTFAPAHDETGARLMNAPKQIGHARVALPLPHAWGFLGLDTMLLGDRVTASGAVVEEEADCNLTLSDVRLARGVLMAVDVKNVLNRSLVDPGSPEHAESVIPQNGRTLRLRLTWGF